MLEPSTSAVCWVLCRRSPCSLYSVPRSGQVRYVVNSSAPCSLLRHECKHQTGNSGHASSGMEMDLASEQEKREQPTREVLNPSNYNARNPAVKRLLREAAELAVPTDEIFAQPLEDNLFEWHYTIRGSPDTDFAQGIYHGRIILPAEYPMKPPSIIMSTPNGRFETGAKICLSISSYHPETWRPSWSIRTALVALTSFMTTDSPGAIGSLEYPSDIRKSLARKSLAWVCPDCGPVIDHIKHMIDSETMSKDVAAKPVSRVPNLSLEGGGDVPISPEVESPETKPEEVPEDASQLDSTMGEDQGGFMEEVAADVHEPEILGSGSETRLRRPQQGFQNSVYGFFVGTISMTIVCILLRRFVINMSWTDIARQYFPWM